MILHLREFRCDNRNRRTLSSLCGGSWRNQVNRKEKSGMKFMKGSMINKVFHLCPPLIKYFKKVNIKRKILKSVKLGRHILYCGNTILYLYLLLLLFNCPVVSDSLWPPWTVAQQASMSFIISRNLPKFMFIASVMSSSHLIFWHPLLLLPSTFPASRLFQWVVCASDNQNTGVSVSASVYTKSLLIIIIKLSVKHLNSLKDILVQIFFSKCTDLEKKKKNPLDVYPQIYILSYTVLHFYHLLNIQ